MLPFGTPHLPIALMAAPIKMAILDQIGVITISMAVFNQIMANLNVVSAVGLTVEIMVHITHTNNFFNVRA